MFCPLSELIFGIVTKPSSSGPNKNPFPSFTWEFEFSKRRARRLLYTFANNNFQVVQTPGLRSGARGSHSSLSIQKNGQQCWKPDTCTLSLMCIVCLIPRLVQRSNQITFLHKRLKPYLLISNHYWLSPKQLSICCMLRNSW